jgi:hypothetical protein
VVDPPALAFHQKLLADRVAAAGPLGLDVSALDARQRLVLGTITSVVVRDGRAQNGDAEGADGLGADHPFVVALEAAPFSPPPPDGFDRAEVRELVKRGLVVERDGVYFAPSAIDAAARVVSGLLAASPEGVTVSAVRDALGTSRKYLLPLLAHLDGSGITRRRGDLRIPGPRLPAPDGPQGARSS